jgi:putative phage-type endonuclease
MSTAVESREEFLAKRQTYLGATDIAAILGVDIYRTALDVYNEKLGLVPAFAGNKQTERGQRLEAVAAQEYTRETGRKVHRRSTELIHPKYDFIRGHIDRRVVGDKRPVEIKCPSRGMFHKIKREGLPDSWIVQMQTYLWLDESSVGDFAPFCADAWETLPFEVPAQPEMYEQIEHIAVLFWTENVLKGVPPKAVSADKPLIEFAKVAGAVESREDTAFLEAAEILREAKQLESDGKELLALAKQQIKKAVDGKFGKYRGGCLKALHYSISQGHLKFDKSLLAAEHPEIDISRYETRGDPFEVLKPYFFDGN